MGFIIARCSEHFITIYYQFRAEQYVLVQCSVSYCNAVSFNPVVEMIVQKSTLHNIAHWIVTLLVDRFFYQEEKAVNVARDLRMPQFELEKVE